LEAEADQTLVAIFRDALRRYRQELVNLAAVAGGPDFEAFQKLMRQCERSRLVCIEIVGEMERRASAAHRPRCLE
jgi:hypothetical protein